MRGWSLEEAVKFYTFLEGLIGNRVYIFYGFDLSYWGFFEWGIMGGGNNCWDFHKINLGTRRNLLFGLFCRRG